MCGRPVLGIWSTCVCGRPVLFVYGRPRSSSRPALGRVNLGRVVDQPYVVDLGREVDQPVCGRSGSSGRLPKPSVGLHDREKAGGSHASHNKVESERKPGDMLSQGEEESVRQFGKDCPFVNHRVLSSFVRELVNSGVDEPEGSLPIQEFSRSSVHLSTSSWESSLPIHEGLFICSSGREFMSE